MEFLDHFQILLMMILKPQSLFFFLAEFLGQDQVFLSEELVVLFEEVDFVQEGEVLAMFDEHGILLIFL